MNLSIRFGAMAPDIKAQLPPGVVIARGDLEMLQRDADAITRLAVRGLLPEGQVDAARRKLVKRIRKAAGVAA